MNITCSVAKSSGQRNQERKLAVAVRYFGRMAASLAAGVCVVTAAASETLEVDPEVLRVGEPITVSVSGVPSNTPWVVIVAELNGTRHSIQIALRNGGNGIWTGTILSLSPAGTYSVKVYSATGHHIAPATVSVAEVNGVLTEGATEALPHNDKGSPHKVESLSSPYCIERAGGPIELVTITNCGAKIVPRKGVGDRWYADLPLSAEEETSAIIAHSQGAQAEIFIGHWKALNLLKATDLTIRLGDSLLFQVSPPDDAMDTLHAQISIIGVTNYDISTLAAMPYEFPSALVCYAGKAQDWELQDVPADVVLDADPKLVSAIHRMSASKLRLSLTPDATQPRRILSRLGTNGPVLSAIEIKGADPRVRK